jgi:glycerol-3-phosphate dehydrogenase
VVNTVLNRCKMPGDGDVIVPIHTVSVIGTTDERVEDPEHLRIEPWEVDLMLQEGDKMVPGISRARILRAWAGARRLYQATAAADTRDVTRSFTLLDHEERDGVAGFLTMTGGKWTTFRLMAERAVDRAAEKLGRRRPCTTAGTPVPSANQGYYWLGHRLEEVEAERLQGDLVCECELVTRDMLENAVRSNPTLTLDDLRRDVRLGMGPCQGGFCTYRATGILHALGPREPEAIIHAAEKGGRWDVAHMQSPALASDDQVAVRASGELMSTSRANLLLRDFLQERWKGVLPILWGRQLKQERLDELIYLSVMNADHLPGAERSSPLSDFYAFDVTPGDDPAVGDA